MYIYLFDKLLKPLLRKSTRFSNFHVLIIPNKIDNVQKFKPYIGKKGSE
jgi:hypothetical protein